MKKLFLNFTKWVLIVAAALGAAGYAFLTFHPVFGGKPDEASLAKMQASKHYDGKQFQNLEETPTLTSEEELSIWKWAYMI